MKFKTRNQDKQKLQQKKIKRTSLRTKIINIITKADVITQDNNQQAIITP